MALHNMLCIGVLIAALAPGDCFYSNMMTAPLRAAVSLLDGQDANRPVKLPSSTPQPSTSSQESIEIIISGPVTAKPMSLRTQSKYKQMIAKKVALMRDNMSSSMKRKLPIKPKVTRLNSVDSKSSMSAEDTSASAELIYINGKNKKMFSRPGFSSMVKSNNMRFGSDDSSDDSSDSSMSDDSSSSAEFVWPDVPKGRGMSSRGRVTARVAPVKTDRLRSWKKNNWMFNRSGSDEKLKTVTAKPERGVRGSRKEIIIIHKTAVPSRRTTMSRQYRARYNNRSQGKFSGTYQKAHLCTNCNRS